MTSLYNIKLMVKRTLFLFFLFSCIQSYNVKSASAFYPEATFFQQEDKNYFLHTIERGQTVYSIANTYNVTINDIYKLNPESVKGIRAGDMLKIPQESGSFLYYTIQPKDNLYSVARKYYMKGEDIVAVNPGLSVQTFTIGKIIRIPINQVTSPIEEGNEFENRRNTNALLQQVDRAKRVNLIRVALFLPFGLKEGTTPDNASRNRFVEYYEGYLLALMDLKKEGISVQTEVFDTGSGTNEILKILKNKEDLQNVHLLIGGMDDAQIKIFSRFSADHDIPYVIPVVSTSSEVANNGRIFQINTPHSYRHSKASLAFVNKHKKSRIILFQSGSVPENRKEFIDQLKSDLKQKNIEYVTITNSPDISSDILSLLSTQENNVIIPTDDSAETLSRIIPATKAILENHPGKYEISLFGHQTWQVYASDFSDDFFRLNTTFYTFFYANPTSPAVKSFYNRFYRWYSRDLINNVPKYGMLGYDTGRFFIEAINRFGSNFDSQVNNLNYSGVQTDFHFERVNNWGGFINTNLYLVDFRSDYTITQNKVKLK